MVNFIFIIVTILTISARDMIHYIHAEAVVLSAAVIIEIIVSVIANEDQTNAGKST